MDFKEKVKRAAMVAAGPEAMAAKAAIEATKEKKLEESAEEAKEETQKKEATTEAKEKDEDKDKKKKAGFWGAVKKVGGGAWTGAGVGIAAAGAMGRTAKGLVQTGQKPTPSLVLLIFLIIIASLDYYLKFIIGFEQSSSLVISAGTMFLFFFIIRNKAPLILFAFDITLSAMLHYIPTWSGFSILILVKLFLWLGAAIGMFLYYVVTALNRREDIPGIVWVFILLLLATSIFFAVPIIKNNYVGQIDIHKEQYAEAFRKVDVIKEAVVQGYNESTGFWTKWWSAFPYLMAGDVDKYNAIMNPEPESRIQVVQKLTATKVEFERPSEVYRTTLKKENTKYPIPYDVNLESLEKQTRVTLSCKFMKDNIELGGEIIPEHMRDIEIFGPETKKRISCVPTDSFIKGEYKVVFEATLHKITTISFLDRIFIERDTKESRKSKILSQRSLSKVQGSRTGDEFATFYFEIGTEETFIYAEDEPTQTIVGRAKNMKDGELVSVERIEIDLRDPRIIPDASCSAYGFTHSGNKLIWQGVGIMPDLHCALNIPDSLRNFGIGCERPEFIHKNFKAHMTYNYKLKKGDRFTVESIT